MQGGMCCMRTLAWQIYLISCSEVLAAPALAVTVARPAAGHNSISHRPQSGSYQPAYIRHANPVAHICKLIGLRQSKQNLFELKVTTVLERVQGNFQADTA